MWLKVLELASSGKMATEMKMPLHKLSLCLSLSLSLQGKPPTKKATVLNKVNKAPPAPTGHDGEGIEHTQTHREIIYVHKHCTKSYFSCMTPPFIS